MDHNSAIGRNKLLLRAIRKSFENIMLSNISQTLHKISIEGKPTEAESERAVALC